MNFQKKCPIHTIIYVSTWNVLFLFKWTSRRHIVFTKPYNALLPGRWRALRKKCYFVFSNCTSVFYVVFDDENSRIKSIDRLINTSVKKEVNKWCINFSNRIFSFFPLFLFTLHRNYRVFFPYIDRSSVVNIQIIWINREKAEQYSNNERRRRRKKTDWRRWNSK